VRRVVDLSGSEPVATEFEAVVAHEARRIRGYAQTVGLDDDDLRQVGQIAVLEALQSFHTGAASKRTWVSRVVRWRLLEAAKALNGAPAGTFVPEQGEEAPTTDPEVDAQVLRRERLAWLEHEIGRLTPRERTAVGCFLAGESQTEVARSLGISLSTLNAQLHEALRKLRAKAVLRKV
jgi:RNA polymerase sigma factor (sigma-70 family)